jgi:hypothetical protein
MTTTTLSIGEQALLEHYEASNAARRGGLTPDAAREHDQRWGDVASDAVCGDFLTRAPKAASSHDRPYGNNEDFMHIAQVNIALARAPLDSVQLSEFVALLAPVNALADAAPGFVWRLQTEEGDALAVRGFDNDRIIVNLSVWESVQHLAGFVYRDEHLAVMRRRREWFERIGLHVALWWVPVGRIPSVDEAEERLGHLREYGPTPYAFTFQSQYDRMSVARLDDELGCPA